MASSEQDVGLDFHRAFQAIDTDHSGEITVEELQAYCHKMNYQESFVKKWLTLFDEDQNGRITYQEYCNSLGVIPKQEVVAKHMAQQKAKKTPTAKAAAKGKGARSAGKRRKELEETPESVVEETISQTEAPTAAASAAASDNSAKKQARKRQRNRPINNSGCLMLHSRARMFQRKALYRLAKKSATGKPLRLRKSGEKKPAIKRGATEKPIGGDKNGGTRSVAAQRSKSLPTEVKPKRLQRRPKRTFAQHKHRLRPSIKPGVVLILLAGRHRGKRAIFLKQLASGLLLVTGPIRVNGCPLRRISQSYVIATRARLCLDNLRVPDRVNDQYFRRSKRLTKKPSTSADLFASQTPAYQLTQERKEDQKTVDAQVMSVICSREDKKLMLGYLRCLFCLKSGQKPHEMIF